MIASRSLRRCFLSLALTGALLGWQGGQTAGSSTPLSVEEVVKLSQTGLSEELIKAIRDCVARGEQALLFRNRRDGTFEDVSSALASIPAASMRGAAFGDLKNDGNVDAVIVDIDGPPILLMNQGVSGNHRVLFKLVGAGPKSNKMAVGARVTVNAPPLALY